ncbi:MAG TPA: hypothetical protein VJV03_02735 [Pyrinomonadaceae bacterium]|nr:hypothetical protein [Pyrinomonadaceae bacterium]
MTPFVFVLRITACGLCLLLLGGESFSQNKKAKNLTRDDIVIKRHQPTIYLCFEKRPQNDSLIWLRITNNTIWTIRFRAEKSGTEQSPLKLSNGKIVAGLTKKSVAFPRYDFESSGKNNPRALWSGFGTASWLPSTALTVFSVPASQFNLGRLYLEYKYEWEFTGAIADESHAPVHRVYLDIAGVEDLEDRRCR